MVEAKSSVEQDVWITRDFDAPRERVFKAWTTAEALTRWSAPNDCVLEMHSFEFRTGGTFRHSIRTPNGYSCRCKGEYLEISEPERIVLKMGFADEAGNSLTSEQVGQDPEWPSETTVTVTFVEVDGKTRLTLHQTAPAAVAQRTGALPSWNQMLDKLDAEVSI